MLPNYVPNYVFFNIVYVIFHENYVQNNIEKTVFSFENLCYWLTWFDLFTVWSMSNNVIKSLSVLAFVFAKCNPNFTGCINSITMISCLTSIKLWRGQTRSAILFGFSHRTKRKEGTKTRICSSACFPWFETNINSRKRNPSLRTNFGSVQGSRTLVFLRPLSRRRPWTGV